MLNNSIAVSMVVESGFGVSLLGADGLVVSSSNMDFALDTAHVYKRACVRSDALPASILPVVWQNVDISKVVPQMVKGTWYLVAIDGTVAYELNDIDGAAMTVAHSLPQHFVGKVRLVADKDATIPTGIVTTCQMGNPSDSSGYQEHAPVRVLAKDGNCHLTQSIDNPLLYGMAIISPRYATDGVLYCTKAMRSDGTAEGKQRAIRAMGFDPLTILN